MEVLAHRSQLLEVELGRTSKQLKEATDFIRDERVKNKAAKEVIKSLTTQVRVLLFVFQSVITHFHELYCLVKKVKK